MQFHKNTSLVALVTIYQPLCNKQSIRARPFYRIQDGIRRFFCTLVLQSGIS